MFKKYTIIFATFLCYLLIPKIIKAQPVNKEDSLALVDLYNSTGGSNWINSTNWLTSKPVSEWYGISVYNNRVNTISLANNNLDGEIPASVGNISELGGLWLFDNKLAGNIPSSIGNLTRLGALYLQNNRLTGTIPSSVCNLTNLSVLFLANNQLSGNIPEQMGNMVNLTDIDLSVNKLSGNIPSSIVSLANLYTLVLNNNELTGSIPVEIGNLSELISLKLSNNQLSGNIPPSIGNCIFMELLLLNNNRLTGEIPTSLGDLIFIFELNLSDNQLSGAIPSSLGNPWSSCHFLNLSNNFLTGTIPTSFGNLTILGKLLLNNNQLSGAIPAEIGSYLWDQIHTLDFRNNQLDSTIPATLGNLRTLFNLLLDHNKLTGPIPSAIYNLHNLDSFTLSYNQFTFGDLEKVAQSFPFAEYGHQARIPVIQNGNTLAVAAGGSLQNNTYYWFGINKNGHSRTVIQNDSAFHPTKNGVYIAKIVNAVATGVILQSDTIHFRRSNTSANIASSGKAEHNIKQQKMLVIYPVPANNVVNIRTGYNTTVELIDQKGKVLMVSNINFSGKIDVSHIAAGIYYMRDIKQGNIEKIIISR